MIIRLRYMHSCMKIKCIDLQAALKAMIHQRLGDTGFSAGIPYSLVNIERIHRDRNVLIVYYE